MTLIGQGLAQDRSTLVSSTQGDAQTFVAQLESVPFVGDGNVSEGDTLALLGMGRDLLRLASLAGVGLSSVAQGLAIGIRRADPNAEVSPGFLPALFQTAALLGYTGSYQINELANWVDEQIRLQTNQASPRY